jgi:GTP cyclohydrolase I
MSGEDLIRNLLTLIGDDPNREGLRDTPARVIRAWQEWAIGYKQNPAEILKTFRDGAKGMDEMVVVHNIDFVSFCEHHMAPMIGIAHVGYIPNGKIVGISKLARLVDCFARRLQVQERCTVQIADALVKHLEPVGVGVLIRASHGCMVTRGVKMRGSVTTTSAMRGALLEKPQARTEFLHLCKMAEKDH